MSYFNQDQIIRFLEQQLQRIEQLEAALADLQQQVYEHDDELTSIGLVLGDAGPSLN